MEDFTFWSCFLFIVIWNHYIIFVKYQKFRAAPFEASYALISARPDFVRVASYMCMLLHIIGEEGSFTKVRTIK